MDDLINKINIIQQEIKEHEEPLKPVQHTPNLARGSLENWHYCNYIGQKQEMPIVVEKPLSYEDKVIRARLISKHIMRTKYSIHELQLMLMTLEEQYQEFDTMK